jgi:hypothetical protein
MRTEISGRVRAPFDEMADVDSGRSIKRTEVWVKGLRNLRIVIRRRRKLVKRSIMERLIRSEFKRHSFVVAIRLFYFFSFSMMVLCRLFVGSMGIEVHFIVCAIRGRRIAGLICVYEGWGVVMDMYLL